MVPGSAPLPPAPPAPVPPPLEARKAALALELPVPSPFAVEDFLVSLELFLEPSVDFSEFWEEAFL